MLKYWLLPTIFLVSLAAFAQSNPPGQPATPGAAQTAPSSSGAPTSMPAQPPAQAAPGASAAQNPQSGQAAGAAAPAQATQAQSQSGANPGGPRKVQAKNKQEYDAFKAADSAVTSDPDLAKGESAAKDFETKFPQSELISILYDKLMKRQQQAGNAEKVVEMGRKEIALDANSVPAMLTVATTLAETTHETDVNWEQNYAEVMKDANLALQLINSGQFTAPQLSAEQMSEIKSMAYAAMGSIEFTKSGDTSAGPAEQAKHDAAAEAALRQATALNTLNPEPALWLRLAVTLDHEKKYPDAMSAANRAVQLSANEPNILALAKQEQTRLQELSSGSAPKPSNNPTPGNPPPAGSETPH